MSDPLFYLFAALAIASALFMISARSAVNSAMAMIVTLVSVAADYFLLDAPFLGVLQVLVYAGAVMVLFLFIIMLLDVDKAASRPVHLSRILGGALVLAILATIITCMLMHGESGLNPAAKPAISTATVNAPLPFESNAKPFGYGLFTKYMLPLQIAGVLLLSAMLAVVSISKRQQAE